MISKLPRWVWFGGWALAFAGGFINVIGLLGFTHQAISHLTDEHAEGVAALLEKRTPKFSV